MKILILQVAAAWLMLSLVASIVFGKFFAFCARGDAQ